MARPSQGPRLVVNARGIFEIRWTEARRSRALSTRTADRGEAEQAFARWLLDREAHAKARQTPRVRDCLAAYLAEHIEPSGRDVARHQTMQRWLNQALGATLLRELRPSQGHQYTAKRRSGQVGAGPAGDGTIRRELGMLQAALHHWAREHGYPAATVPVLARPEAPQSADTWLTAEQVDVLLQWFADVDQGKRMSRVHRFVVLGLATAARKGAIEALTWPLVDLHTRQVRFDRQVRAQTRKRRVAAPIPDWLMPYLERMHGEAISDLVLDHDGDIRSGFDYAMALAAEETGQAVFADLTRHALRHTTATLALQAGATLWQVAGLLGDKPETVAKVYGHHAQDHLRDAANSWRQA